MSGEAEESSKHTDNTNTDNSKISDNGLPNCYVCKKSENNLIQPCNNCKSSVFYHQKCLEEMIQTTKLDQCLECNSKFTGVKIKKKTVNFCHYLQAKPEEMTGIIIIIPVFAFLYYIIYLGVIAYIISKGILDNTLRWILLVPTVVFGLLFTLMLFGYFVGLCSRYRKWKAESHNVTVIPINRSTSNRKNIRRSSKAKGNNKNSHHRENP